MISAASRAIWSWVSVTEAPWSMITTICFDCGLTAETYTGLPTHRHKDLQSPRTLQNDFSWTLTAGSQVKSWRYSRSLHYSVCARDPALYCVVFGNPFQLQH